VENRGFAELEASAVFLSMDELDLPDLTDPDGGHADLGFTSGKKHPQRSEKFLDRREVATKTPLIPLSPARTTPSQVNLGAWHHTHLILRCRDGTDQTARLAVS